MKLLRLSLEFILRNFLRLFLEHRIGIAHSHEPARIIFCYKNYGMQKTSILQIDFSGQRLQDIYHFCVWSKNKNENGRLI
ncbi:hypothetical protein ACQ1Z6_15090, partial [Enterococcus faecalis]